MFHMCPSQSITHPDCEILAGFTKFFEDAKYIDFLEEKELWLQYTREISEYTQLHKDVLLVEDELRPNQKPMLRVFGFFDLYRTPLTKDFADMIIIKLLVDLRPELSEIENLSSKALTAAYQLRTGTSGAEYMALFFEDISILDVAFINHYKAIMKRMIEDGPKYNFSEKTLEKLHLFSKLDHHEVKHLLRTARLEKLLEDLSEENSDDLLEKMDNLIHTFEDKLFHEQIIEENK